MILSGSKQLWWGKGNVLRVLLLTVACGQNEAKRRNRHCIANWDSSEGEPPEKVFLLSGSML
jgi:hypothetical protein